MKILILIISWCISSVIGVVLFSRINKALDEEERLQEIRDNFKLSKDSE